MTDNGLIENMAKLDAYLFKYKPESLKAHPLSMDDKTHVGLMAQEMAENPVTEGAISEKDDGTLQVDTRMLCMTLAAVVADLSQRVLDLEELCRTISQE